MYPMTDSYSGGKIVRIEDPSQCFPGQGDFTVYCMFQPGTFATDKVEEGYIRDDHTVECISPYMGFYTESQVSYAIHKVSQDWDPDTANWIPTTGTFVHDSPPESGVSVPSFYDEGSFGFLLHDESFDIYWDAEKLEQDALQFTGEDEISGTVMVELLLFSKDGSLGHQEVLIDGLSPVVNTVNISVPFSLLEPFYLERIEVPIEDFDSIVMVPASIRVSLETGTDSENVRRLSSISAFEQVFFLAVREDIEQDSAAGRQLLSDSNCLLTGKSRRHCAANKKYCDKWIASEGNQRTADWVKELACLFPCPRQFDERGDDFKRDIACSSGGFPMCHIYHPGASVCIRSKDAGPMYGGKQQCCYDSTGRLITSPPGAGTADREASFDLHKEEDVKPFHCTKWFRRTESGQSFTDAYYDRRPQNDGTKPPGGCCEFPSSIFSNDPGCLSPTATPPTATPPTATPPTATPPTAAPPTQSPPSDCPDGFTRCRFGGCVSPPDRCCRNGSPSIPNTGGECPCGEPGGSYCAQPKQCCSNRCMPSCETTPPTPMPPTSPPPPTPTPPTSPPPPTPTPPTSPPPPTPTPPTSPPPPPPSSSSGWGDPHLTTFDGLKFDCQALGLVILLKSLDSPLQIQARFGRYWPGATITEGIVATDGQQTVEMSRDEDTLLTRFFIDGNETSGAEFNSSFSDQFDYQLPSGIKISINNRRTYWNFDVSLPPSVVETERIVGILGSPNGNSTDDWMTQNGTVLPLGSDLLYEEANEYCTQNWCVQNETESLFSYYKRGPSDDFVCDAGVITKSQTMNAPQCLRDFCGGNEQCIIDGVLLGRGAAEGAFRANVLQSCTPSSKPCYFSCADALQTTCDSTSRIITICPNRNESEAINVYCDQESEDGGWMLLYSYNHVSGSDLPLQPGTVPLSPISDYSHFFVNLVPNYFLSDITSVRFFCETSGHSRVVHFKSDHSFVKAVAYNGNQVGNLRQYWDDYTCHTSEVIGHNATLPRDVSNQDTRPDLYLEDGGFHQFPFWRGGQAHWAIRAFETRNANPNYRFECDDYLLNEGLGTSTSTRHNVWVKLTAKSTFCDLEVNTSGLPSSARVQVFNKNTGALISTLSYAEPLRRTTLLVPDVGESYDILVTDGSATLAVTDADCSDRYLSIDSVSASLGLELTGLPRDGSVRVDFLSPEGNIARSFRGSDAQSLLTTHQVLAFQNLTIRAFESTSWTNGVVKTVTNVDCSSGSCAADVTSTLNVDLTGLPSSTSVLLQGPGGDLARRIGNQGGENRSYEVLGVSYDVIVEERSAKLTVPDVDCSVSCSAGLVSASLGLELTGLPRDGSVRVDFLSPEGNIARSFRGSDAQSLLTTHQVLAFQNLTIRAFESTSWTNGVVKTVTNVDCSSGSCAADVTSTLNVDLTGLPSSTSVLLQGPGGDLARRIGNQGGENRSYEVLGVSYDVIVEERSAKLTVPDVDCSVSCSAGLVSASLGLELTGLPRDGSVRVDFLSPEGNIARSFRGSDAQSLLTTHQVLAFQNLTIRAFESTSWTNGVVKTVTNVDCSSGSCAADVTSTLNVDLTGLPSSTSVLLQGPGGDLARRIGNQGGENRSYEVLGVSYDVIVEERSAKLTVPDVDCSVSCSAGLVSASLGLELTGLPRDGSVRVDFLSPEGNIARSFRGSDAQSLLTTHQVLAFQNLTIRAFESTPWTNGVVKTVTNVDCSSGSCAADVTSTLNVDLTGLPSSTSVLLQGPGGDLARRIGNQGGAFRSYTVLCDNSYQLTASDGTTTLSRTFSSCPCGGSCLP